MANSNGDTNSYLKTMHALIKDGVIELIDLDDKNKKLILTEEGHNAIDFIKSNADPYTNPDFLDSYEPIERRYAPTSDFIMKYILGLAQERGISTEWAYPIQNESSIILDICAHMEASWGGEETYEVVTRRIHELAQSKKFLDTHNTEVETNGLLEKRITNIRLTQAGLERLDRLHKYEEEDSKLGPLIDEELVEEADLLAMTNIALARELGLDNVARTIQERLDEKHFYEMSEVEFYAFFSQLSSGFDNLRRLKISKSDEPSDQLQKAS